MNIHNWLRVAVDYVLFTSVCQSYVEQRKTSPSLIRNAESLVGIRPETVSRVFPQFDNSVNWSSNN